jgi:hypothetical protein
MSGVSRLVQEDNDGLEQVTNENLKEEGVGNAVAEDTKE